MALTINTRTGEFLHKEIIQKFAELDVLLQMMRREDEDKLIQWLMEGGTDVSLVGRCLLLASFDPSHSLINLNTEE